jgi:hypothetical protein
MKASVALALATSAAALLLSACGLMSLTELSTGLGDPLPDNTTLCPSAAKKLQAMAKTTDVSKHVATVQKAILPALQKEKVSPETSVLHQLTVAAHVSAHQTHSYLAQKANVTVAASPAPQSQPHDLTMADFLKTASVVKTLLLDAQTMAKDVDDDVKEFQQYFLQYFAAYYKGAYYDRFGTPIPPPAISTTIADSEISSTMTVLVDVMMDYILRTPVWVDNVKNPTVFYPGGTNGAGQKTKPTVYTVFSPKFPSIAQPIILEASLKQGPKTCGITDLKAEAIQYIALSAGSRAQLLAGGIGGSFGGVNIGLGLLGKVSIGDNKTLQALAKAGLGSAFTHVGGYAAYQVLQVAPNIAPPTSGKSAGLYGFVLQYVQTYLATQINAATAANGGST